MERVLAQTYLGNVNENERLAERVSAAEENGGCLAVEIGRSDRTKGRILVQTAAGQTVGIVKDRTWQLREGDVLETAQGKIVVVHLESQQVMALRFSSHAHNSATALVQLGYVLGNQHWPTTVQDNVVYIESRVAKETMKEMVREIAATLGIEGLQTTFESKPAAEAIDFQRSHVHTAHSH